MASSRDFMQVQRDLGRILEAVENLDKRTSELGQRLDRTNDRIETQSDKFDELNSHVAKMDQSVQSVANITTNMAMEKYGERLNKLEALTKDLPDLLFWNRLVGTGMKATVRVSGALLTSGSIGAGTMWILTHLKP